MSPYFYPKFPAARWVALLPLLWAGLAHAALPDNADELLRAQQREEARRQQLETNPAVRLETAPAKEMPRLPEGETPCFVINSLMLQDEEAGRFQWLLNSAEGEHDSPIGRCLGVDGVNVVLKRLQNELVARGYVTSRVLAAPQDLKTGILAITLIPGRIRAIRFTTDSSERATQLTPFPMGPGDLLNLRDIEQALENFKRIPTAEADIQIAPSEGDGALPGDSDLLVSWKQSFPLRLTLTADDSGTKATGKQQGSMTVSADNLLGLHELFYLTLNHDLAGRAAVYGTQGGTLHLSVPFGYWLLGINHSTYSYYQSVAGANQTYVYRGNSSNNDIRLSCLIWRDATSKTTLGGRIWERDSNNFIDDTEVLVQRRRMAGWEINASERLYIGSATVDANLAYRQGTGAFHALPAPEEAFGEGTSRSRVTTADVQAQVPFEIAGQRLRYTGNWRAQWNETPLVPQDRFAIGGRFTVRGFDGEMSLSAERGWLVRNDIGAALGASGAEAYLGADVGQVGGPSAELLLGRRLAGAVLGVRGGLKGVSYDLFVGKPLAKPEGFRTATTSAGFSLNWTM